MTFRSGQDRLFFLPELPFEDAEPTEPPRQLRNGTLPRWDFLAGALPGRANPTDIDLTYERRGCFLFLEGKRPGQVVPRGQEIYFDALHAMPRCLVLRFEGHPPATVERFGWWGKPLREGNVDDLRAMVRRWYEWASEQVPV